MSGGPVTRAVRSLLLLGVAATIGVAPAVAGHAAGKRQLTLYAKATRVQYVDHSDDRERGFGTNPFSADAKPPKPLEKTGNGPVAGDNALFSFRLYSDPRLAHQIGTAVYSCTFGFNHQALCDAQFGLTSSGSTIMASGPVDFAESAFTFAITGGENRYLGVRGQVTSTATAKNAHRLDFTLR
jgi:hypothetical protein